MAALVATNALTHANDDLFERSAFVTVTALAADGACVFFERGSGQTPHLCAIHRIAGHDAKPVSCRQFPRVSLHDARGVSVSLSHFCPTAAELLFDTTVPLEIIEAPPAFPSNVTYDGLNALDAFPPLLAPGMLMDLESYDAWEHHMIAVLARSSSAAAALGRIAGDVEELRGWKPAHDALGDAIARLTNGLGHEARGAGLTAGALRAAYARVGAEAVRLATPSDLRPTRSRRQAAIGAVEWGAWEPVVCRYLAARAFASWTAYQGRGLRTVVASLYVALDLVRSEAAVLAAASGGPLDRAMAKESIRQADLRFVHQADSQRLAELLAVVER